jgi:hypothetical protein
MAIQYARVSISYNPGTMVARAVSCPPRALYLPRSRALQDTLHGQKFNVGAFTRKFGCMKFMVSDVSVKAQIAAEKSRRAEVHAYAGEELLR